MKLCKDCEHIIIQKTATAVEIGFDCLEHARCKKAPYINPVTGETEYYRCRTQRAGSIGDDCGKDAKHFEPKER